MYKIFLILCLFPILNLNAQLGPGNTAIPFSLKNVDGKTISLYSLEDMNGAILVFTCNSCSYSKSYEERINQLHKKYAPKGFPVIAINPNDPKIDTKDSYENMVKYFNEKKYSFYYLQDITQEIAKAYDVQELPYVFLLQKYTGGNWGVEYTGAIDDSLQNNQKIKNRYVETAIQQIQDSVEVNPTSTKTIGCGIKWRGSNNTNK
ncbi:MAG: thioredoxin family protein [Bacteroidia bacterium]|nr:thioredoxin family protein [Bacteroidia bacterium]